MSRLNFDGSKLLICEAAIADKSGSILLSLRNDQIDMVQSKDLLLVRNAKIDMVEDGHMRVAIDRSALSTLPSALSPSLSLPLSLSLCLCVHRWGLLEAVNRENENMHELEGFDFAEASDETEEGYVIDHNSLDWKNDLSEIEYELVRPEDARSDHDRDR